MASVCGGCLSMLDAGKKKWRFECGARITGLNEAGRLLALQAPAKTCRPAHLLPLCAGPA